MGNGSKAEMLIAVCAVISSIAAVYIAWDQARVMRSQEKADVWPIVQLIHETSLTERGAMYEFRVENAGVGPALIDEYLIAIPGDEDDTSFRDMVNYYIDEDARQRIGEPNWSDWALKGRVLRPGASLTPVGAYWEGDEDMQNEFNSEVRRIALGERANAEVFVCYCSILSDCWVSTTMASYPRPTEISSCENLESAAMALLPAVETTESKEAQQ